MNPGHSTNSVFVIGGGSGGFHQFLTWYDEGLSSILAISAVCYDKLGTAFATLTLLVGEAP